MSKRARTVTVGRFSFSVDPGSNGTLLIDGKPTGFEIVSANDHTYGVLLDGRNFHISAVRTSAGNYSTLSGGVQQDVNVSRVNPGPVDQGRTRAGSSHTGEVRAPMPALVSRIEVHVGDEVVPGQGLLVLEAMKMENELKAHEGGVVKEIRAQQGKPVEKGELLIIVGQSSDNRS